MYAQISRQWSEVSRHNTRIGYGQPAQRGTCVLALQGALVQGDWLANDIAAVPQEGGPNVQRSY